MVRFRQNPIKMVLLPLIIIVGFCCFAVLALRRYSAINNLWFLGLLPAVILAPFVFWVSWSKRSAFCIFLVIFLVCGLLYTFAVPMLQVSDEQAHFLRSYEIVLGQTPKELADESVGDTLPGNLVPDQLLQPESISYHHVASALHEKLDRKAMQDYSFSGSALYSPVTYLTQFPGIWLFNKLTDSPVLIMYAGRISNLIALAILAALAVKVFPFSKALPMLALMVPIFVHKCGSMSADGLTLTTIVLFLSYLLYLQYGTVGRLSFSQILPLYLLVFVISQCKVVYLPVCLAFFLISPKRFGKLSRYFLHLFGLISVAVGASLAWLIISSKYLQAGYSTSTEQINYLLNHPLGYVMIMLRTFRMQGRALIEQMIGIGMGVGGVRNSRALIYGYLSFLLFASVFSKRGSNNPLQKRDAPLFLISALVLIILTCMALFIQWTKPDCSTIMGLQGRYFLPVLYLILFALMQIKLFDKVRINLSFELMASLALGTNLVAVVGCFAFGSTL